MKKQGAKGKSKQPHARNNEKSSAFKRPRHEKLEIKFDPDARKKYLTGLSAKKKEKRTFGLAMQKVKDRRAKLEEKQETRKAILEQIEEAEKSKQQELGIVGTSFTTLTPLNNEETQKDNVITFQDQSTQSQFGGQVIVTTTYNLESDDDSKIDIKDIQKINKIDTAQRYAGSVEKYLTQLKGHLPNKKRSRDNSKSVCKRGKHGAESMKGMGTSKDFKMAKRTLDRMKEKKAKGASSKGKKSKSRR